MQTPPPDDRATEIEAWQEAQHRVRALVAETDAEQWQARVPACPDWSARELLAHVVGLAADVLAGDEPDDHAAWWTQAQVDARADRSVTELLAEWADTGPRLVAWMAENGTRPLNDVVVHEQDLRGALGLPGARDTDGFAIVRDRMAGRVAAALDGRAPLALVASDTDWSWCSAGPVEAADVRLEASGFDLGRALVTRRSAEELRAWTVRGDVTAYLDAFAHLGELPAQPLPGEGPGSDRSSAQR